MNTWNPSVHLAPSLACSIDGQLQHRSDLTDDEFNAFKTFHYRNLLAEWASSPFERERKRNFHPLKGGEKESGREGEGRGRGGEREKFIDNQ